MRIFSNNKIPLLPNKLTIFPLQKKLLQQTRKGTTFSNSFLHSSSFCTKDSHTIFLEEKHKKRNVEGYKWSFVTGLFPVFPLRVKVRLSFIFMLGKYELKEQQMGIIVGNE